MVQLVNFDGLTIGSLGKIEAHQDGGLLHRAVSVILLDEYGRMLVQRRSDDKYHFRGRWANASCTHPEFDETPLEAATRALQTELGVQTTICEVSTFAYQAYDPETDYTEREFDHIFFGLVQGDVVPNPTEVAEFAFAPPRELQLAIIDEPEIFAPWLIDILTHLGTVENLPNELRLFMDEYSGNR